VVTASRRCVVGGPGDGPLLANLDAAKEADMLSSTEWATFAVIIVGLTVPFVILVRDFMKDPNKS
jgi:hypothetical protein